MPNVVIIKSFKNANTKMLNNHNPKSIKAYEIFLMQRNQLEHITKPRKIDMMDLSRE